MDAQLAIIMANQAQVTSGNIMLDPFVGSGSLLVAAAHFGGKFCFYYIISYFYSCCLINEKKKTE